MLGIDNGLTACCPLGSASITLAVLGLVYTPKYRTKVLVSCNLSLETRIQCITISDLCIGGYIEEECVVG